MNSQLFIFFCCVAAVVVQETNGMVLTCALDRQWKLRQPGEFVPECDSNGDYKPLQCDGSTGQCWCVTKGGLKVKNSLTHPGQSKPQCTPPSDWLTKCQKERKEAKMPSLVKRFVPVCDAQGAYDPMQCDGYRGSCWCVDNSGDEMFGTRTAPGGEPPLCGLGTSWQN